MIDTPAVAPASVPSTRAPIRSTSGPSTGAEMPATTSRAVSASDIAPRLQPRSSCIGARKKEKTTAFVGDAATFMINATKTITQP